MYNTKLKADIEQRLQRFAQEEMGNRLTLNNWNWLIVTINNIFEQNKVKPEEAQGKPKKETETQKPQSE